MNHYLPHAKYIYFYTDLDAAVGQLKSSTELATIATISIVSLDDSYE